ncbi:MAG: hypothetical protein EOO15_24420, partial [Chitinophagaceae bacterium]
MKRILTSALAILLLAGAAKAQTTGKEGKAHKGDRKEHRQDMAALNLSADQKTKLKSIHDREKTEMDALRSNTSLSADQRRTQAKAIHEKYGAERKAILTPEQQQKAAQFREQWKDRRGGRDTVHGRRPDGQARGDKGARGERGERFQKMQQELNLTADQQQR